MRMVLIDQPIEALPSPPEVQFKPGSQRFAGRHKIRPRDARDLRTLDSSDDAARQPGPPRQIDLAPALAQAERSNGASEPPTIHPRIVTRGNSPLINGPR